MAQTVTAPVICVGVNPSFDITLVLDALYSDRTNRVTGESVCAAGKSANVAAELLRQGQPCRLIGFAGEDNAKKYAAMLMHQLCGEFSDTVITDGLLTAASSAGFSLGLVTVPGGVRENLTVPHSGKTLKINRAGAPYCASAADRLMSLISAGCSDGSIAVFSGSVPPGMSGEDYANIMHTAAASGTRLAIDTDALDMTQLINLRPWLYKPNSHELAALFGLSVEDETQLTDCARYLAQSGVDIVLLTLGQDGLAAVTADSLIRIPAEPVNAVCTVGAGDCSLAGFIAGTMRGYSIEDSARLAAHCGALAVSRQVSGSAKDVCR